QALGNTFYLVKLHHRTSPKEQIRNVWPVLKPIIYNRFQPGLTLSRPIQRHAQYSKVPVFESIISSDYIWIFLPTGRAPACPKINQYILATQGRKCNIISRRIWERKVWRNGPNRHDTQSFHSFEQHLTCCRSFQTC